MNAATRRESAGLWLGLLGVAIFAATLPMTRLAIGPASAPQLPPEFVTFGRAVLAAALSALFLLVTRSPWPQRAHVWPLLLNAAGSTIGFPLLLALALRSVTSAHAAVILAVMPLATAALAAWVLHQRASLGFWLCAVAGTALVVLFALWRATADGGRLAFAWADLLLLGAVLAGATAYVMGARLTPELGAERVICWVCLLGLPVTLPGMWLAWPSAPVTPAAWAGFAYVGVFSMWAGFFAWYRGLAWGGAMRVSQVQLLQPFLTMLFAVPLGGEAIEPASLVFAAAVVATVLAGRRMMVAR